MSLPNLFILGGQKCATTSLADLLMLHPEISFCKIKEPFFLCFDDTEVLSEALTSKASLAKTLSWQKDYDKLLEIYEKIFPPKKKSTWLCEATTLYLPSKVVPERIKGFSEDPHFIILLREPLARSKSAYYHYQQRLFHLPRADDISLNSDPLGILRFSCYQEQLEHWFSHFKPEKFFVATFEEFVSAPESLLIRLRNFLKLNESISSIQKKSNVTYYPKFNEDIMLKITGLAQRMGVRLHPKQYCDLKELEALSNISLSSKEQKSRRPLKRKILENILMQKRKPQSAFIEVEDDWAELLKNKNLLLNNIIPEAKITQWW